MLKNAIGIAKEGIAKKYFSPQNFYIEYIVPHKFLPHFNYHQNNNWPYYFPKNTVVAKLGAG